MTSEDKEIDHEDIGEDTKLALIAKNEKARRYYQRNKEKVKQRYRERVNGEKTYKCEGCGYASAIPQALKNHLKTKKHKKMIDEKELKEVEEKISEDEE